MSKWLKIYATNNSCELILNKDLIESVSNPNSCMVDIIIGRFLYSIIASSQDLSVFEDVSAVPDYVNNIDLIRRIDLVNGDETDIINLVGIDYD